jgi:hypothetical protein
MSLESFERRGLALKIETTENVDAVPTSALNAFLLMNGSSGVESEKIERPIDRPFFGADPFVNGLFRGYIEGDFEVLGAATAGLTAPIAPLLRIGGMAETLVASTSATYNPISSAIPSASAYFWHAGTLKKLLGSRAQISQMAMKIGDFFKARMRIEGNCTDVLDTALPTDFDLSAFRAPPAITTETMILTINGSAVEGVELSLDFGTEMQVKEHSEARVARIQDRKPSFTARFYKPTKATLDLHQLWRNHTLVPIVGTVDGGATKKAVLTIGYGQIESISEIDLEKDYGFEVKGRCIPSAGNDEFTLALT